MREVDILIAGGIVLTLTADNAKINDGAIAVAGDQIVAVGERAAVLNAFSAKETIEAPQAIIMPGLINSHTHAAMTCFRGIADDMELMGWLNDYIFPAESRNVNPELAYWGSLLACAEMIKSGTTAFSDMYIFESQTARAVKEAGMRCLIGEVLYDFPSPSYKTPAEGLACTETLIKTWADDPLVNIMVEPHSLYTCSPELLKASKRLADAYQVPLATHLLENMSEAKQLRDKFGMHATLYLRNAGLLDERFIGFHCVVMNEEDIAIFADHGCKVVHNPESNMKLASGVAPISAMLKKGVCVGLGTDGCASNNNLDMFQEMDTAAKLEKSARLDPTVMSAETVLRMATVNGAKTLGMGDLVGTLEVGKKADILIIDTDKPHLTPMYDPYSHLAYAVNGSDVETVLINGKIVMRNRKLTTIDEHEVMVQVRRIAVRIKQSLTPPT